MDKFTVAQETDALAALKSDYRWLVERGEFDVGVYRPDKVDAQAPHMRDELYVVASGTGHFIIGDETQTFEPGDMFFVPAGVEHRFEDFSDDLLAWVVFFGTRPSKLAKPR